MNPEFDDTVVPGSQGTEASVGPESEGGPYLQFSEAEWQAIRGELEDIVGSSQVSDGEVKPMEEEDPEPDQDDDADEVDISVSEDAIEPVNKANQEKAKFWLTTLTKLVFQTMSSDKNPMTWILIIVGATWGRKGYWTDGTPAGFKEILLRASRITHIMRVSTDAIRNNSLVFTNDIRYQAKDVFPNRHTLTAAIAAVAGSVGVTRRDLNIIAAPKGMFAGSLQITYHDKNEPSTSGLHNQSSSVPRMDTVKALHIDESVKFIAVTEKATIFLRLLNMGLTRPSDVGPGVLFTGRGRPDEQSQIIIHRAYLEHPGIPCFGICDPNPAGISILCSYLNGPRRSAVRHPGALQIVPGIKSLVWLCFKVSALIEELKIPPSRMQGLTETDIQLADSTMARSDVPDEWKEEMDFMVKNNVKADLELVLRILSEEVMYRYIHDQLAAALAQ